MEPTFPQFGLDDGQEVPGELIVKLTPDAASGVTASIPGPRNRSLARAQSRFGHGALDKLAAELKVEAISKVHGVLSPFTARATTAAEPSTDIADTYRLRLSSTRANVAKAADQLLASGDVLDASPNYYRYASAVPNDPEWGLQWGLVKINCPDAWDRQKGSPSVVVAVVDSGVDLDHPDLAAQLLPGNDLVDMTGVTARPGWHFEGDFVARDSIPADEVGHGTHVAGTIAALTNNAAGVAGVTWFCKILPVRVLARMVENAPPRRVTGVGTAADIAAGIRWAADHGAHVINLSLGGGSDTFAERDAVAYAVSRNVVVVAAMGNDASSAPSFPAAYPDVVAVGATDQADHRATFSNTGAHIDVAAPGVGIRSTVWDNGTTSMSGTSMATPHVAGVAALVRSCNPGLTAAQVGQILRDTARNLRDAPIDPVPNDRYGWGCVDAKAAVDRACPPVKHKVADDPRATLKFRDDRPPTLKFFDDRATLKVIDDKATLKFVDDPAPTLKFRDDQTFKFQDDHGGGTLKAIDDRKNPAFDPGGPPKFGFDPTPPWSPGPGPAPFALATPHHSMAWTSSYPEAAAAEAAELEAMIAECEAAMAEAQAAGAADEQAALEDDYRQLTAAYERLAQGQ